MTLKQLLTIMIIATIICWLSWLMIITQIDPGDGFIGIALFYGSLFFSLLGFFFLISFGWRKIFSKYVLDYKIVGTSFRQSIFFALLVILILFLQSKELLSWWNLILIILALTVIEGFSLSLKKQV